MLGSSPDSPPEEAGFELRVPASKGTAIRRARPFVFWRPGHRPRSFLSPRATTSNSRHPKVISLVEISPPVGREHTMTKAKVRRN